MIPDNDDVSCQLEKWDMPVMSFELRHEISNNVINATSKGQDQPVRMSQY